MSSRKCLNKQRTYTHLKGTARKEIQTNTFPPKPPSQYQYEKGNFPYLPSNSAWFNGGGSANQSQAPSSSQSHVWILVLKWEAPLLVVALKVSDELLWNKTLFWLFCSYPVFSWKTVWYQEASSAPTKKGPHLVTRITFQIFPHQSYTYLCKYSVIFINS